MFIDVIQPVIVNLVLNEYLPIIKSSLTEAHNHFNNKVFFLRLRCFRANNATKGGRGRLFETELFSFFLFNILLSSYEFTCQINIVSITSLINMVYLKL